MSCKEFQIEVEESATGRELTEESARHARVCGACRRFYSERRALREILGKVPAVSAPADFDFRLRARLAATRNGRRGASSGRFNFSPGNLAITVAASFALLFACAVAVQQFRSSNAQRAATAKSAQAVSETSAPVASNSSSEAMASSTSNNKVEDETPAEVVRARYEAKRQQERQRAASTNLSSRQRNRSEDFVGTAAPPSVVLLDPELHIELSSPLAPSRLFVNEHDGTRRDVSLKPVSFGSQNILPLRKTADSSTTGIW